MSYRSRFLYYYSFLLVFCIVFLFFVNQGNTQDNPADYYQTLLDRLKNGDTSINFAELRVLFAQLPTYNPYKKMQELRDKENQMWQEYKSGNYQKALEIGNSILEINYLRIMTHYIFSEVYGKLGDTQKQKFHEDVFFGLVDSIIQSGDGKSPETAMTVIEVREEYDVLDVLGFEQESQTLVEKDGKRFDFLVAKNSETGETRDFYFNIDLFYDKALEGVEEDVSLKTTPQAESTSETESGKFLDTFFIATLVTGTKQEIEAFIQDQKVDFKLRDKDGNTALMIAAMGNSNHDVINYLLSLGIDINAKNNKGDTALIKAASLTTEPKIIEALLMAGADPTIKNLEGTVAYEYAQLNPDLQGTEVLTKLGQATLSGISPSPTPTTIEPSVPTSMIPIPEPSLLPIATPTPQVTALPQPTPFTSSIPTMVPQPTTQVVYPQMLTVNPPPGWISQPTEDPTQIGYYQLANQQNIVIAEYIVIVENLSSSLDLRGYLSYLQGNRLKPPLFNSYIPQQTIDTSLVGLPALRHDFLFTTDDIQLKAMAIFVILGNKAYTFLFYSTVNDFPNLEAIFLQALSTVSVQDISGHQPTPSISISPQVDFMTSPTPQQPTAGNWYQDPSNTFSVLLPSVSVKKQDIQNGVVFSSPNNGEIYVMNFSSEMEAQNMVEGLAGGKSFRAETTLNAGNRQAQVKIYGFTQNNMNYAMLISSYPGTPVLVLIVIPADQYNASQAWMISTITGIQFR